MREREIQRLFVPLFEEKSVITMGLQTVKLLIHFARANQGARSKIFQTLQQASKYANQHT